MIDAHPPNDMESERCLIGCGLVQNSSLDEIVQHVQAKHFYAIAHRKMFEAIRALIEAGQPADAVTVRAELERRGDLDAVGGVSYIVKVLETVPHAAHAEYYARLVRSKADQRELLEVAHRISVAIQEGAEPQEIVAEVESSLYGIVSGDSPRQDTHIAGALEAAFEEIFKRMGSDGSAVGLSTGFSGLDDLIRGLQKSRLYVLAARPGMGKTALALNILLSVAIRLFQDWEHRHREDQSGSSRPDSGVLFVSMEMPRSEIAERLLSLKGRVDGRRIAKGELNEVEQFAFMEGADVLRALPVYVDDTPGMTITKLEAICRREARKNGIKLIVVDHLGLIEPENRKNFQQEAHTAMVSRRLKVLANSLEIPVLALCQLNRDVERREDKRPRLADLRSSGAIEQDADTVMFLHRPEVYEPGIRPGEADLAVLKNRGGELGVAELIWRPQFMEFSDKSPIQEPAL